MPNTEGITVVATTDSPQQSARVNSSVPSPHFLAVPDVSQPAAMPPLQLAVILPRRKSAPAPILLDAKITALLAGPSCHRLNSTAPTPRRLPPLSSSASSSPAVSARTSIHASPIRLLPLGASPFSAARQQTCSGMSSSRRSSGVTISPLMGDSKLQTPIANGTIGGGETVFSFRSPATGLSAAAAGTAAAADPSVSSPVKRYTTGPA
jgi:hypothetical protein